MISSSSMSTRIEKLFITEVFQKQGWSAPDLLPSNKLMIRFLLYKATGSRPYDNPRAVTYDPHPCLQKDKTIVIELHDFLLSSARPKHTKMLAKILTRMDILEDRHQNIIEEIFLAVKGAKVSGPPMLCVLTDATLRLIRTHFVDLECLEKVRLDSLEDTTRQEICAVCRECLDHQVEDAEEFVEQQSMITRLPCRHLYHGDCIVKWSEESNLCPLCRDPMPTIELAVDPSTPPGWRIFTACVIAAMLIC